MTNVTLSFPAASFVMHTHINPIRLRKMPTCLPFPSCVLYKEHFNLPYQFKIFERFYVLSSLIEFTHLQPKRPARTWFCGHKSILLNYLMHNTFRSWLRFSCSSIIVIDHHQRHNNEALMLSSDSRRFVYPWACECDVYTHCVKLCVCQFSSFSPRWNRQCSFQQMWSDRMIRFAHFVSRIKPNEKTKRNVPTPFFTRCLSLKQTSPPLSWSQTYKERLMPLFPLRKLGIPCPSANICLVHFEAFRAWVVILIEKLVFDAFFGCV